MLLPSLALLSLCSSPDTPTSHPSQAPLLARLREALSKTEMGGWGIYVLRSTCWELGPPGCAGREGDVSWLTG